MAVNRLSPGCGCCDGHICVEFEFVPPFTEFATAEGTPELELSPPRLTMATNDVLEHGAVTHDASMQAWYHEIGWLKGSDFDLLWDGLVIKIRSNAATVESAGETIPIVPLAQNQANIHQVVLYVTASWYAVIVRPNYPSGLGFPGVETAWRGCVQVVNRTNDLSEQGVKLTAGTEGAEIISWDVVDSTVTSTFCARPLLPPITEERWAQHQDTTLYNSGGDAVPTPFSPTDIFWVSGSLLTPRTYGWPNTGITESGFVDGVTGDIYTDRWGHPTATGEIVRLNHSLVLFEDGDRVKASAGSRWNAPTTGTPYPKPMGHYELFLVDAASGVSTAVTRSSAEYNHLGRAPAVLTRDGVTWSPR